MWFLADENFPGPLVTTLRRGGHDVEWIQEASPGIADRDVLARATAEGRTLLTFDKDFGELAIRFGLAATSGVVLFRLTGASPEEDNARAAAALTSRDDWPNHFSVVTDDRIRMRRLT